MKKKLLKFAEKLIEDFDINSYSMRSSNIIDDISFFNKYMERNKKSNLRLEPIPTIGNKTLFSRRFFLNCYFFKYDDTWDRGYEIVKNRLIMYDITLLIFKNLYESIRNDNDEWLKKAIKWNEILTDHTDMTMIELIPYYYNIYGYNKNNKIKLLKKAYIKVEREMDNNNESEDK